MNDKREYDVAWDSVVSEAYVGKAWDERKNTYVHAVVLKDFKRGRLNMHKWDVLCRRINMNSMSGDLEALENQNASNKCIECEKRITKHHLLVYRSSK